MKNTKPDLTDVTFLIHVRLDSIDRLENILAIVDFLKTEFNCCIRVFDYSAHCNGVLKRLIGSLVDYKFVEDFDPILHLTRCKNDLVHGINTPYIAFWDVDVLVNPLQILKGVDSLRKNEADFVIPYADFAYDTSLIIRNLYLKTKSLSILENNCKKMKEMYGPNPVGGIYMTSVFAYLNSGGENEDFYGWGMEDGERYYRWENQGYRIKRISGPLFHLTHGRGINSIFHNADQQFFKRKEVLTVRRKKMDISFYNYEKQTITE